MSRRAVRRSLYLLSSSLNQAAPPTPYPLSLHDALPISKPLRRAARMWSQMLDWAPTSTPRLGWDAMSTRSEEHTSELQSRRDLVCRLLLEKKNLVLLKYSLIWSRDPYWSWVWVAVVCVG